MAHCDLAWDPKKPSRDEPAAGSWALAGYRALRGRCPSRARTDLWLAWLASFSQPARLYRVTTLRQVENRERTGVISGKMASWLSRLSLLEAAAVKWTSGTKVSVDDWVDLFIGDQVDIVRRYNSEVRFFFFLGSLSGNLERQRSFYCTQETSGEWTMIPKHFSWSRAP